MIPHWPRPKRGPQLAPLARQRVAGVAARGQLPSVHTRAAPGPRGVPGVTWTAAQHRGVDEWDALGEPTAGGNATCAARRGKRDLGLRALDLEMGLL